MEHPSPAPATPAPSGWTGNSGDLPDDLRLPLHSLQADVKYLIGRVLQDKETADMISENILQRLSHIEEAAYRLNAKTPVAPAVSNPEGWMLNYDPKAGADIIRVGLCKNNIYLQSGNGEVFRILIDANLGAMYPLIELVDRFYYEPPAPAETAEEK